MKAVEWLARCPFCGTSFIVATQTIVAIGDTATRLEDHLVAIHRTPREKASRSAHDWGKALAMRAAPGCSPG